MTHVRPIHDNVLLKVLFKSQEEVLPSGLVKPATVKGETRTRGEVVAVGPGRLVESGNRLPVSVKPGDQVTFELGAGTLFAKGQVLPEHEAVILTDEQITGVFELRTS